MREYRPLSRREFISTSFGFAAISVASYSAWFEPFWIELSQKSVDLGRTSRNCLRIAHLADFHAYEKTPLSFIAQAINLAIEADPDIICLTGDYISFTLGRGDEYRKILKRLSDAKPTFATLGNHDGGRWSAQAGGYPSVDPMVRVLEGAGIRVLRNQAVSLAVRSASYTLVGLDDYWSGTFDPNAAFVDTANHHGARIVLSHNPDTKDELASYPWDLMLSGHTHGGQVKIPLLGITPILPVRDRRYVAGLYALENRFLHITRGVGSTGGVRLNCPPEVSILEILS